MTATIKNEVISAVKVGGGYFNTDHLTYPPDAMAPGSDNMLIVDNHAQRVFRGLTSSGTGGRVMFSVAGGHASLNDDPSAASGSIFNFINESLFAIGNGAIFYNGTDTTQNATSTLQIAPKVGAYTYPNWYAAGFTQPDAPTVFARDASGPYTGLMTGTYSFKIARVRSTTGARSIASVTSAVITCTGQTVRLTFPAAASNGQDRWAIFGTKAGFGGVGVHYLIEEIDEGDLSTIDTIARSYVLEYNDSDLLPITAYIDDYPPQAGLFAGRLENYVLNIGCYGNAIQASVRNFPESFHPEHLAFLPKPPTAVLQDPQGTYMYVSTESSVHAVSVVPSVDNPLLLQTLWSDVGVANSHNWCSVNGVLFAFTGKTGAVTMGENGRPDPTFAIPVAKTMRDWVVANVVVHHVPHLNSVAYSYQGDTYLFNLQTLKWSSPARLSDFASGNIVSAVVHDRKPYITMLNGSTFTRYEFDTGSSSTTFSIVTPDNQPYPSGRINILGLKAVYNAPNTGTYNTRLRTDFASSTEKTLPDSASVGMNVTGNTRWYLPRRNSFSLEFTGTQTNFANDCYLSHVLLYGTVEDSTVLYTPDPIAFIDSVEANDSGGGSEDPTTAAIDTTEATLLVAVTSTVNAAAYTVSDSKGNTWSSAVAQVGPGNIRVQIHYVENPTVGSGHTFTATGGGGFVSIAAAAFSVTAIASVLDQTNSNGSATAGSITPTQNRELIIAAHAAQSGTITSIDGGFTIAENFSGNPVSGGLAYLIQTTAAAANPTWTGGSGNLSAAIASFKAQ